MSFSKSEILALAPRAQAFYDRLFENPEVCSHCFTQIRDVDPFPDDKNWGSRLASHPTEYRSLADGGEPGHDSTQHDQYGAICTYHPRTFCGHCGRNGLADAGKLSKSTLLTFGRNIVTELDRQGVACDLDALRASIARSTEQPALAGYPTEVLALATAQGIAHSVRTRDLGSDRDRDSESDSESTPAEAATP